MTNTRILISGASIAGPSLAYWLDRYGFDVTVVEKAADVRAGGQPVDFKGPIQMSVLEKMGILETVKAAHVQDADARIVNAAGRKIGTIPGAVGAGEVNVPRGDLARIVFDLTKDTCDYLFADSITSLTETADGVEVCFARGTPRTFDIVVGADGMHSNVRRLAFGPESDYVTHLGAYYVLADLAVGSDVVSYSEPGIMATLGATKAAAFLAFTSSLLPSARDDVDLQKKQAADALQHGKWRIPELVASFPDATDFYLDSISRATVDHYARGRVVLIGDSAWGNALGGYGTGLALVGAYVLAGELARAGGDHIPAFTAYEAKFRGYASVSKKVNAARLIVPRTWTGIRTRNLLFTLVGLIGPLVRALDRPASNITLDDYDLEQEASTSRTTATATMDTLRG